MSCSDREIANFAAFAERLADAAKTETLARFRNGATVIDKDGPVFDPVTDADRGAERAIRAAIAETYRDHGVLGEEFGETPGAGLWRWIIDPVDGTRAFMCGVATWTTLIALEFDGAPILGLIDQPYTEERWIGLRPGRIGGKTLFHRSGASAQCRTSGVKDLARARLSTTDPRAAGYFSKAEARAFERLSAQTLVQRFSMDAYAYGLLALGEIDLIVETSLKRHDYAALGPVVEGAGGVVTNWRGEPLGSDPRGETLAAATPELHAAAMAALKA